MAHLPRIGETFDRYRIDSQVGFGGMGVVLAATDLRLGRQVALKVIAAQHADNEEFRLRFEREAEIMTRLDSPHVLTIYDHGVHDGIPWLATPLIGGGDLGTVLREHGGLPLDPAATIVGQVAGALHDAHLAGVVHRDVKPSNVLMRAGHAEPHAYLCDFGVAHSGSAGLTATGGVAGSWAYIAPERTMGDPGSPASDIYSLGCLFWACLTGQPPYSGVEVEMAMAHVQAPLPQLLGTDEVTVRINSVLRRALAKDPGHRYDCAEDLRSDLLALSRLDSVGFVAKVPTPLERGNTETGTTMRRPDSAASQPSRTRRHLVVAATALVLVAGAAVAAVRLAGGGADPDSTVGGGVAGDVDGDGRGDLILRWYDYSDDLLPSRDYVVRSTGEGYDAPEERPRPEGLSSIGDVDGDGRADRIGLDNVTGTERVVVQTILADGTEREVTWAPAGNRADGDPALADVNGDGLDDLLISSDLEASSETDVGRG
ncbi:MAG: protein kinase, partial [Nocardioides sp.]|nr:protein kinase [Nocardioides sp.]